MLRLTKLEIRKFDGVEPTTLTFGPGFNVLLGKNATGKTTLLEIIAAILADYLGPIEHRSREIDLSYELATVAGPLRVNVEAKAARLAPRSVRASGGDPHVDMRSARNVRISGRIAAHEFEFTSGGLKIADSRDEEVPLPPGFIWSPRFLSTFALRVLDPDAAFMRETNPDGRMDEALGLWDRWLGPGDASNVLQLFAVDTINHAMSEGRAPGVLRDSFQRAVGSKASEPLPNPVTLESTVVPALDEAVELFDLAAARFTYALRSSEPVGGDVERGWSGFYSGDLTFERDNGSVFPADWLSFGQKRMLTFLLYEASTRGTPAVLDELVNGLHYEWVEICVEKLRDRQSFVTAQNPLILDLLGFESMEQVRETFVQCARGADGRMAWTNFSDAQAKEFYDAYAVGILHVHEVLRNTGLW